MIDKSISLQYSYVSYIHLWLYFFFCLSVPCDLIYMCFNQNQIEQKYVENI